ncbi:hypothetical protein [Streptosporangium sp. H16]
MAKELAAEIAAKARPQLGMIMRTYPDEAVSQVTCDTVNDIARDAS